MHNPTGFDPTFRLTTSHARVEVTSEAAYWKRHGGHHDQAAALAAANDLVRLTDDSDTHLLLAPPEALTVAAALQAVAVHLLEQNTRQEVAR